MFCSVMKNQTKRLRVGCVERVPYLRMHATVFDMTWKTEVVHVLRSRTVTVDRFILSRYRAGTRAIREHFQKDRKAKKKAKKLQKANEQ